MNAPRYQGASILLARENERLWLITRTRAMGTGRLRHSRHDRAELCRYFLWQLDQQPDGARASNGTEVDRLFQFVEGQQRAQIEVDAGAGCELMAKEIAVTKSMIFVACLLNGLDNIGLALQHERRS